MWMRAWMRRGYELILVTVAAHHLSPEQRHDLMREALRHIVEEQKRARAKRRFYAAVIHGTPTRHVHVLVALPHGHVERLRRISRRETFAQHDRPDSICFHVGDPLKTTQEVDRVVGYVLREMTVQAAYVGPDRPPLPRRRGSHQLEGGGDRVRLSDDLKEDLLAAGRIEPYRATYAKVPKDTPRAARVKPPVVEPLPAHRETLFDLAPMPRPPRLLEGNEAKITSPTRLPILVQRGSLLPFEMPPDAVDIVRAMRGTHAQKAALLGLSRQQLTNVQNRQFGASRKVVERILEVVGTA